MVTCATEVDEGNTIYPSKHIANCNAKRLELTVTVLNFVSTHLHVHKR